MATKSVIQDKKECYFCKKILGLNDHHIFGGVANRPKSEFYGLKVWLCCEHHTGSRNSVHMDRKGPLNRHLQVTAQKYYEEHYGTREDFIKEFGKNYI